MGQPVHLYKLPPMSHAEATAQAVVWVPHVKSCQFCLSHLIGLNRHDAVAQYFASDAMGLEDHSTQTQMTGPIRPTDDLYDELIEILVWYYMFTAPR